MPRFAPPSLALLPLLLAACPAPEDQLEPPPAPLPSDQLGPYEVGATTLRQVDERGKFLHVEVWYPALPGAEDELQPYEGIGVVPKTYRDVPFDLRGAPYPLVAFSHGYAGIRFQSSFLTTWLASHGFVVVAVDHIDNTLLDLDDSVTARVAIERPADVSLSVDMSYDLLPDGLIDPDAGFAMMGHSFGAWTTLVVGGGELDRDALLAHCEEFDDRGCAFFTVADVAALDDLEQAVPDPRARIAVSMSPGLHYSFGEGGVGLLDNVPTLVFGGTLDEDMPYDREIRPVFESLGPGSALASLEGAGHFAFSDLCELGLPLPECEGAAGGWMDIERAQELTRVVATAWVRARWLGEGSEEAFLSPAFVGSEGDATWEVR